MLKSRLEKPLLNKRVVERPRLMSLLKENEDKQVILVSAPAGYGKSVAISQWSKQQDCPIAWVTLNLQLNNLASFLSHVVAAFRQISPNSLEKTLALSRNRNGRSLTEITDLLSIEIGALGKPLLLVLDDYHNITAPEVHFLMQSILEHPPVSLRIILLTRSDLPFRLSRLRLYDELFEVTEKDLSFTEQEIELYLRQYHPNLLDAEIKEALYRAEGWILGINLILSTHHLNPDRKVTLEVGQDIDYLVGQLCADLSTEVFEALCLSTLLESFTAELLDTLFRELNSIEISGEAFIQEILSLNLFLTQDEHREGWFYYHQLFRELVGKQCKEHGEGRKQLLLSLASQWFAKAGYVDKAVDYAVAAQNWELAVTHIVEFRIEVLDKGQWWEVQTWIHKLPIEHVHRNRSILLALMWVNEYTWRLWEIPKLLIRFENLETKDNLSPRDWAEYEMHLGHHYLFYQSDPSSALKHLEKSKNTFEDEGMLGGIRELCIGIASHMTQGNKHALERLDYLEDNHPFQSPIYFRTLMTKVFIHLLSSDFDRAEWENNRLYTDVTGTSFRSFVAWSRYLAGNIDFQYGRKSALMHFESAVDFEESMNNRILVDSLAAIALSHAFENDEAAAWKAIGKLKYKALQLKDPHLTLAADSAETRLHLIFCHYDTSFGNPLPSHEVQAMGFFCLVDVPAITQIRLQVCVGSTGEIQLGLIEIKALLEILQSAHNTYHNLDLYLLCALGYFRLGKQQKALRWLTRALDMYNRHKNIRPYVEIQKAVPEFFQWAPDINLPAELSRESPRQHPANRINSLSIPDANNVLTIREKEVVRLVCQGMRNSDVAAYLDISEVTVKTHLTNIFRKLGAHNRTSLTRMVDLS